MLSVQAMSTAKLFLINGGDGDDGGREAFTGDKIVNYHLINLVN